MTSFGHICLPTIRKTKLTSFGHICLPNIRKTKYNITLVSAFYWKSFIFLFSPMNQAFYVIIEGTQFVVWFIKLSFVYIYSITEPILTHSLTILQPIDFSSIEHRSANKASKSNVYCLTRWQKQKKPTRGNIGFEPITFQSRQGIDETLYQLS